MTYLTNDEIAKFLPAGNLPKTPNDLAYPLREGLTRHGVFTPEQMAGRTFPIACVALEITQKCNLDCTLCYLSDYAEIVEDVPLFELKRRIKVIHDHYGDYTNIQVTGGDPTLRSIPDLVEIVKEIKSYNMRAALFTNGIKASRKMLESLAKVGLDDVVYHVDLTQERKGYESEQELNKIRLEYIERTKGLPIRILFNTTLFDKNFHEISDLICFFKRHSDKINMASFQLQADTGRGILRERNSTLITQKSVMDSIAQASKTNMVYDMPLIGHPDCNKYTALLTCGDVAIPLYEDKKFFSSLFEELAIAGADWTVEKKVLPRAIKAGLKNPKLTYLGIKFIIKTAWKLRSGLIKGHKINRISFFIHNFMDAKKLEKSRCESCVFMVATANGPLSMCVHNAKRDKMIAQKTKDWDPLSNYKNIESVANLPRKKLKGRLRKKADIKHSKEG